MENENKEERKSNGFLAFFVILIIIIGVAWWLIYPNIHNKKKIGGSNSNSNSNVDEPVGYVYEADYFYKNKYTEYSDGEKDQTSSLHEYGIPIEYKFLGTQYIKNLKVPYINLNSEDAKKVNDSLKKLYLKYAETFDSFALAANNSEEMVGHQILSYVTYSYGDILSVLVVHAETVTSPFMYQYITYNFDIKTGKLLTYDETLSKLGYNKITTVTKAKELLKQKMDSLYTGIDLTASCGDNEKDNCYEMANQNLDNAIMNNDVLFFVDNEGFLNLLLIPYNDAVEMGDVYRYAIKVNK